MMSFEIFVVQEVTDAVEDASVVDRKSFADQSTPDTLSDVAFTSTFLMLLLERDMRDLSIFEFG